MDGPHFQVRALSISEILDEGYRLFRHGLGRFLLFQLILYVPSTAVLAFGIYEFGETFILLLNEEIPDLVTVLAKLIGFLAAIMVVQMVAGALVMVATSRAIADSYRGRSWTTKSMLVHAWRLAPRAIAVSFILTNIYAAAILVPILLGGAVAFAGISLTNTGWVVLIFAGLLGVALLCVSLIFVLLLMLRYSLTLVALAVEETNIRGAFDRSVELMRGRYARGLALMLVLIAVNLLISSVLSIFMPTPSFEGIDPDELRKLLPQLIRGQVVGTILGQVTGVFVQIFTSICFTLFYFTARCESEAFDLTHLAEKAADG